MISDVISDVLGALQPRHARRAILPWSAPERHRGRIGVQPRILHLRERAHVVEAVPLVVLVSECALALRRSCVCLARHQPLRHRRGRCGGRTFGRCRGRRHVRGGGRGGGRDHAARWPWQGLVEQQRVEPLSLRALSQRDDELAAQHLPLAL